MDPNRLSRRKTLGLLAAGPAALGALAASVQAAAQDSDAPGS